MSSSNVNTNEIEEYNLTTVTNVSSDPCEADITEKAAKSEEEIPSKSKLRKKIIAFAWPCVAELFLVSLISIVNLIMVGHLGPYAISAVGITTQPVFVSVAVFQAFNIGATALVARFIGAKDYTYAKEVAIQALMVSVLLGAVLCFLGYYFAHWIVVSMGAQEDTIAAAELYMKYMGIGMIFQAIPTCVSSLLRGAGDTKSPMRYNIASNIINVATGFFLINGFWFIPSMGVEGAAIAATAAKVAACVMSIYIMYNNKLPIALTIRDRFHLDFSILKRIMNIGYSAAGEQFVLRVGLLVFTKLVADLGTIAFAAHQISINIIGLSINIGSALGMAATSFMGRSLGAKKPELAEIYGKEIRRMGMAISIVICVFFFFTGRWIAMLYTSDESVIVNVALLLKIVALYMPLQTSQLIIAGGLRGAGDTRWPLISTMAGIFGIRMPTGFLFIKIFEWGLVGAWVSLMLDQFIRSAVIFFRFKTGKWKYTKV